VMRVLSEMAPLEQRVDLVGCERVASLDHRLGPL
jgi:hypothetical protein